MRTSLHQTVLNERSELIAGFDGSGKGWCSKYSALADSTMQAIMSGYAEDEIAIVAVGGYGRRELGPHSDLDFVFLAEDARAEDGVRSLYRDILQMSEQVGWEIDSALRYPSDAPGLDDKSRTALLDARLVTGSTAIFDRFMDVYYETFPVAEFLAAKRRERLELRQKHGYTPRLVEFNLKEGAGGLRDIHAAGWYRRMLKAESIEETDLDYDYFLAVRNALQICTERKEDRLLRTRHGEVAALVSVEPQMMFTRLMRAAESFQEEWRKALYLAQSATFDLAEGVTSIRGVVAIDSSATLSEAARGVCRAVDLDLRIPLLRISNNVIGDGPAAADMLSLGSKYLRALNRAGVLSAIIPTFGNAIYLTPDDSVHQFTVGEHTLAVIDNLDRSKESGNEGAAWSDADQRTLYLAAIIHDLGKADSAAPHSVTGEEMARDVERRLDLERHEGASIAWLVREHLSLARIARTYDLQMPEAPVELAKLCGDQQRLAMLFLLTLADIAAVSTETLTPQFEAAIRDLYEKARSVIGVEDLPTDPATYRIAALDRVRKTASGESWGEWLEKMPTHYVIGTPREQFATHATYIEGARAGETIVVFENDAKSATTELTVCRPDLDRPGLLSRILGVIYAHDINVHGVRASSTHEKNPIVLDQVTISYRQGLVPKNLSAAVSKALKECLTDETLLNDLLLARHKNPDQKQHFLTYRFIAGEPAVIEFETPTGRGMPYRVTKMLAHFGWNVYVAKMGQWAGRAVSRFYLSKPEGTLTEADVASAIENYRRGESS